LPSTNFYKTEIFGVPGLVTTVMLSYEGITDDSLEVHRPVSWDDFRSCLEKIAPQWRSLERATVEHMALTPDKGKA
jgi:hypothetical protein